MTRTPTVEFVLPRSIRRAQWIRGLARRQALVLSALALVGLSIWWKASSVRLAFFKEDDFEFVARAMESGLTWDFLTRVHVGQFMPVGFALAWVVSRLAVYGWGLAAGSILALHALAGWATFVMLREVFGPRRLVLLPLGVSLFAPFTVPVLTWWAAALNTVPLQLATAMAITAHVRFLRTGSPRQAVFATLWVLFALFCFVKAVFLPVLLVALTVLYGSRLGFGGPWRRLTPLWLLYGAAGLIFGVMYMAGQASSDGRGGWKWPGNGVAADFVWTLLGETFPSTVLGGPWTWFSGPDRAVAAPQLAAVVLSWVVLIAVVVVTVRYRRDAWKAWTLLLGYLVLADVVPPLLTRVYLLGGFLGMDTRYIADAAPVLALTLGLATLGVRGERQPYIRELPAREQVVGGVAIVASGFLVGSLASNTVFAGHLGNDRAASYLNTARAALAKARLDKPIFDRFVPGYVLNGGPEEYRRTSRLLGPLADEEHRRLMLRPFPADEPVTFDDDGRLRRADVIPGEVRVAPTPPPGSPKWLPVCWPRPEGVFELRLYKRLGQDGVIKVRYSSPKQVLANVEVNGVRHPFRLEAGTKDVYIPAPGAEGVRIVDTETLTPICYGDVSAGKLTPAAG